MEKPVHQLSSNPLVSYMRQPKIFIRLPSGGRWWKDGSLSLPENGEIPVYSMTAKDELMLKVPDAWDIPSIDVDYILIAIRLATFGEQMKTPINVSNDYELEHVVDLRSVMDYISNNFKWDPIIPVTEDLTVFVKPLTYKDITNAALQTFETQKLLQIANDESMSEDDKVKLFQESFAKLTQATVGIVESSVFKVDSSNGSTDNPLHIKEFVQNVDRDVFNTIQSHLENLKIQNTLAPIRVTVTEDMKASGVSGDVIEVPLVFDASSFFA
jgi:hypothetical protein